MINGQLSPTKQRFVALMNEIRFGRIEDLTICGGEPVLEPLPRIIREYKFGAKYGERITPSSKDFALKSQVIELFAALAKIRDGGIEALEIRNGLPFRLIVAVPIDPEVP